jgi:hypothetical protein
MPLIFPSRRSHHLKPVSSPNFIFHFCFQQSGIYTQMQFIVAFKILTSSILLGTSPLGVTGFPGRCSSQKKKRKAIDKPDSQKEVSAPCHQSPRLHAQTQRSGNNVSARASVDISPVMQDPQLSSVEHDEGSPSPDLLDGTQGSIIPGIELPPFPAVAHAHSHDSSSAGDDDDLSADDQRPVCNNTPTKTTGEDDGQSEQDIKMGQPNESQFRTDFCFGQFNGEYDMAAEDYSFHERVMHHLGGRQIDQNNQLAVEFACTLETGTIVAD